MLEITGNLFTQYDADAICITTNGYVNSAGANTMGRGSAGEAKKRWPGIELNLGYWLVYAGNRVHLLTHEAKGFAERFLHGNQPLYTARIYKVPYHIVSFPTKPATVTSNADCSNLVASSHKYYRPFHHYEGWRAKSDLTLIMASAIELVQMTDHYNWAQVVLPRPGCGAGELSWEDQVRPMLREVLDDRFRAIHFG